MFAFSLARMAFVAGIPVIGLMAAQDLATAISAFDKGKYEDAARALSDILHRTPDDPDANYYLGMTYFRAGRPKDARTAAWLSLVQALFGSAEFRYLK